MEFKLVDSAHHVTLLFDHAQRLFPVLCHYEGWDAPSDIDFNYLVEQGWSKDNAGWDLWDTLEGEVCRGVDMAQAVMSASGLDLTDMVGEEGLVMRKGDLLKFVANMVRKELAARKFEEVFGDALKNENRKL